MIKIETSVVKYKEDRYLLEIQPRKVKHGYRNFYIQIIMNDKEIQKLKAQIEEENKT